MNPAYLQVSSQIWSDEERVENSHAGIYVAVSGNTGSGKSALIDAVVRLAQQRNIPVIGVNEREIHHPYLRLMFSDPGSFAFPIQVNFLLQRYLVLLRHLKLGHVVIIERSHLDRSEEHTS